MWVFTPRGFFSATLIEPNNPSYTELPLPPEAATVPHVMVRARVYGDLNELSSLYRREYGAEPPIYALKGHDYPYRAIMPRSHWAQMMVLLVERIDYSNFKNAVTRRQGNERHDLYMKIWSVMYGAEVKLERAKEAFKRRFRPEPTLRDYEPVLRSGGNYGHQESLPWANDPRSDGDLQALCEEGWYGDDPPEPKPEVMDPPVPGPDPDLDDVLGWMQRSRPTKPVPRRRRGKHYR